MLRKKAGFSNKKLTPEFGDYGFYIQKQRELLKEQRRREKIKEFKGDPVALSKILNRLNLSDSEYIEFSFSGIDSSGIVFLFCDLKGSDFSNSRLYNCDFTFANLQNCNFRDAVLRECTFRHTNLRGADFKDANLLFCDFTGSNIRLLNR